MVMVEVPSHTKVSDFFLISIVYQYQQEQVVRNSCSLDPPKALEGSPRWPSHGDFFQSQLAANRSVHYSNRLEQISELFNRD